MSDSKRRYCAIRDALRTLFPSQPKGNVARHLNTTAAFISGIVASGRTNFPDIAAKVSDKAKQESRTKRFHRYVKNVRIDLETYFLPFARVLLASLAHLPLVLAVDGSTVGRGCMCLMVGVVYKKRTLPVVWTVVRGKKGHLPEELHMAVIRQAEPLIPEGTQVIVLGDGEFDGVRLQALIDGWNWKYVLRTGNNIKLFWQGDQFYFEDLADSARPGDCLDVPGALFTRDKYGPVLAITWWRQGCKEPIHLVTNMGSKEEACQFYTKRFRIETLFSDQKSRGFHLHKSHLSEPERLSRLMIPACLAYYWIIYLGVFCLEQGWRPVIHRTDRCDLSLFQLGLRLLDHFLNELIPLPTAFVDLCRRGSSPGAHLELAA